MPHLSPNWLLEGWMDYEYKQYLLLDYLQQTENHFKRQRLYPFLGELIEHHQQVIKLQNAQIELDKMLPKQLERIDWPNKKLAYSQAIQNNNLAELQAILELAVGLFSKSIDLGAHIYDTIEKRMQFESIGLQPLEKSEGYLLLTTQQLNEVLVYQYRQSLFSHQDAQHRSITTRFLRSYQLSLSQSIDQIKLKLIQHFNQLPNPATFVAIFQNWIPVQATLLPIAKRYLMRQLAN